MNSAKALVAEFIGTFWLVLGGCGAAVLATNIGTAPEGSSLGIGFVGVSLAFGLTVVTGAYALGHVSGGHFNPAVTLGVTIAGKFSASKLVQYWIAQVVGAFAAAIVIYLVASGADGFAIGDGAGAFVLEAQDVEDGDHRGVIASYLRTDGRHVDLLYVDGGVSSTQSTGHVRMQGNRVFREAVNRISEAMVTVCKQAGVEVSEIDWFVPHQANERIIHGVVKKLSLRTEQVVSTIANQGNTSAASIPLAYRAGVSDGRIKKGDLVLLEALGGGLTWGAALLRA